MAEKNIFDQIESLLVEAKNAWDDATANPARDVDIDITEVKADFDKVLSGVSKIAKNSKITLAEAIKQFAEKAEDKSNVDTQFMNEKEDKLEKEGITNNFSSKPSTADFISASIASFKKHNEDLFSSDVQIIQSTMYAYTSIAENLVNSSDESLREIGNKFKDALSKCNVYHDITREQLLIVINQDILPALNERYESIIKSQKIDQVIELIKEIIADEELAKDFFKKLCS